MLREADGYLNRSTGLILIFSMRYILDVWKYLVEGETIVKEFKLKGYDVHATNRRVFVSSVSGSVVQDYDYNHISSLLFKSKRYFWLIFVGVAVLATSWYFLSPDRSTMDPILFWIATAAGIGLLLLGIFLKIEVLRIYVTGAPTAELQGKRADLEKLFQIVREKSIRNAPPVPKPE